MSFLVLRRAVPLALSLAMCILVGVPLLLAPGGVMGGYTIEYIQVERICLLGLMLLWQPPRERTLQQAMGMGCLLGIWQYTKFGGAFFALASVMIVDCIVHRGERSRGWSKTLRDWAIMLGVFALWQALFVLWAYRMLTAPLAWDTVWPSYIVNSYPTWSGPVSPRLPPRFPSWGGGKFFAAFQWLPAACALIAAITLSWAVTCWCFRAEPVSERDDKQWCLGISGVFFAIASIGYLRIHTCFISTPGN